MVILVDVIVLENVLRLIDGKNSDDRIRSLERRSVFGDSFILKFVQDYSEKMKKLDFMNENYGIERYV